MAGHGATDLELSVVLVNYNDRVHLPACLSSLEDALSGLSAEVILVDNQSEDGSPGLVRSSFPWVRLVENDRNVGYPRGNNIGFRQARGECVLFLNTDTVVPKDAAAALLAGIKARPEVGAIGPALVDEAGRFQVSFGMKVDFWSEILQKLLLNRYYRMMLRYSRKPRAVGWLSGACLLARRAAVEAAGLFDEGFFLYFEDIDLCQRIAGLGFKLIYYPGVRVSHVGGGATSSRRWQSRLEYRRSQIRFYEKYNHRRSRRLLRLYLKSTVLVLGLGAGKYGKEERRLLRNGLRGILSGDKPSELVGKFRIMEMIDRPSLGGGQTALLLLAENLGRRRFEVVVSASGFGPLTEEAGRMGIPYCPVPLGKRPGLRPIGKLARVLKDQRIDLLHTHGGIAGLYGRSAARRARTPAVVHTLHGIHYLHYRNPLLRRLYVLLERRYSRSTDRLILVCQSDLRQARKHRLAPEEKMSVILNGAEVRPDSWIEDSARRRSELGWAAGPTVIGTVSRLHRQKGVVNFLRAGPLILAAFPDVRFAVVGDGPEGGSLRREARRLGLEDRFLSRGEE
jgi:GT2 family glycosyltransferase